MVDVSMILSLLKFSNLMVLRFALWHRHLACVWHLSRGEGPFAPTYRRNDF